jgi:hypothetical protein
MTTIPADIAARPAAPLSRAITRTPDAQIIVTANGPGEVAAWLYPFAAALHERAPNVALTTALLPCVFASGAESAVVRGFEGMRAVARPADSMRWIFGGTRPAGFLDADAGCVLHLGGELTLSVLLAKRLGYPIVAYAEDPVPHAGLLDRICVVDARLLPKRHSDPRYRVVGNLMVDAARRRVPNRESSARTVRTIALFPGSREYQVRSMLPFLVKVAGDVAAAGCDLRWVLAKSDFLSRELLGALASHDCGRIIEGENARWIDQSTLMSDRGVCLRVASPAEAMRVGDLALTIPGTNTAELAALGIPMILLLPTNGVHTHPLPGLAGHVGALPVVGPWIKRAVATVYLRRIRHWAHPNRRVGESVVPELVGRIRAADVARATIDAVNTPTEPLARRLREIMGPPGGAARLVDEVLGMLPPTPY